MFFPKSNFWLLLFFTAYFLFAGLFAEYSIVRADTVQKIVFMMWIASFVNAFLGLLDWTRRFYEAQQEIYRRVENMTRALNISAPMLVYIPEPAPDPDDTKPIPTTQTPEEPVDLDPKIWGIWSDQ